MPTLLDPVTWGKALSLNEPIRFKSFPRPMVWGGRKLESQLGKTLPETGPYGESWEISDHPSHLSIVESGPFAGKSLRFLMKNHSLELLGNAASHYRQFPWLVKFLDAEDWLSVQVHPNEKTVSRLWPGEQSKNEAWFILDASPESRVFAGLLPGVTPDQVREASLSGKVAKLLHQFHPRPGDFLYLPAGTVHAVGGGVLIAEIQETSDATFRLFDWNRKNPAGVGRALHLEESLACIDWAGGPKNPVVFPGFGMERPSQIALADCPYFQLEYRSQSGKSTLGGHGRSQIAMGLEGEGSIGEFRIRKGETLLLPASMQEIAWVPQPFQGLLLATLPKPVQKG